VILSAAFPSCTANIADAPEVAQLVTAHAQFVMALEITLPDRSLQAFCPATVRAAMGPPGDPAG
jgi:hypothetical protein